MDARAYWVKSVVVGLPIFNETCSSPETADMVFVCGPPPMYDALSGYGDLSAE